MIFLSVKNRSNSYEEPLFLKSLSERWETHPTHPQLPYVDGLERWISNSRAASTLEIHQLEFSSKSREGEEELPTPHPVKEMYQVKFGAQHFTGHH